ncbi:sodium:alanine symporter family protein [Rhizobium sp. LC145]|jgi:AGCS family alanine or glycine:cation symporter|uniref:alanine/glycine:cation symporter family protein n=1 Tax=Rhizobium sp. LC145 TaxID=1120688 RepID=UPI000629F588|nr:sodium:alanine symporter family protein [Rhizobium sp. LC145]KKX28126.1 sodium:alanine symporter [Rhizobium sp. LC145]TKT54475.1 alanine:cation symporter family protein [Rhizobiaceae bacterium LC148]
MTAIIGFLNTVFWGYVLIYGLIAVGLFFTVRLGFLQFRHFPEFFRVVLRAPEADAAGITPFQALCTSLASRVGTGNLAGVAVAMTLGGPGALFWMWVVAALGMATAYAESALAQLFKVRGQSGEYRGGPAFYISRGLNAPWAAVIFAVCLILVFGLAFNAVQANSIAEAMHGAFGVPKLGVGVVVAGISGVVIFGGIKSIARIAEYIVPFMAVAYLGVALYVLIVNIADVPAALSLIVRSAFGFEQAVGGMAGAMLNGVKRGLFSNEAGMGSAPNIAAVATPSPHHPSSQGMVQALGVFIDTLLICTATGLIILLSGALVPGGELTGTPLTQAAMAVHIGGAGHAFIAIAIFFFAWTSVIGNYSYAENALVYLGLDNKVGLLCARVGLILMVLWGSYESATTVFDAADASMGLMASINLVAIVLLSPLVVKLTRDYFEQRRSGAPVFDPGMYPELAGKIDADIWHDISVSPTSKDALHPAKA